MTKTSTTFLRRLFSSARLSTGARNSPAGFAPQRAWSSLHAHVDRRPWASSVYVQRRTQLPTARLFSTAGYLQNSASGLQPPEHLNELEAGIFVKLAEKLTPTRLDVRDISGGCGSMYAVEIESPLFRGLATLKMHRQVQDVLAEEIKGWHGIQLKTKATPLET
ncbi:hypothetical protein ABW21_db0200088 [Orbilia brochopaga]|nr:hypothetical protein ABW21_db0200088 [Drechslerella brochopaga]